MSRRFLSRLTQPQPYICPQCIQRPGAKRRTFHTSNRSNDSRQSVLNALEERGYVNQIAGDRNVLEKLLNSRKVSFYAGVDPTAPSLHLGHLLPIMVLFWVSLHGHSAVSLVGGGTARVGDPSGRLTSRAMTSDNVKRSNAVTMFQQTSALWRNAMRYAERHGYQTAQSGKYTLLDNSEWLDSLNILDFLKMLGDGMRLGTMLGRDTVRNKMEKGDGMSFSEFTYPLLQGWDWWHMYNTMGVQIQIGGSDQYGNIIAGMDAVKHIAQNFEDTRCRAGMLDAAGKMKDDLAPMGLTVPLLTTSSGEKFGKSAGNAIWLNRDMTSSFDLYGFLLRSSDSDVERYLKLFTFVPTNEVLDVMTEHRAHPEKRRAQHLLASEVLELVHGQEEALKTKQQHELLRNPSVALGSATTSSSDQSREQNETARIQLPKSLVLNTPFARILYHAGLVPTKSEGARLVAKGGAYIASAKDNTAELVWSQVQDQKAENVSSFLVDRILMLRIGKWKVRIVEVLDDDAFEKQRIDVPGWIEWKTRQNSE